MPELRNNSIPADSNTERSSHLPHGYRITRKGSRYNIIGPEGRIFTKNKSASVAGPRWEELTHTPWPHASSAYEPGLRLWELGLIPREAVHNQAAKSAPAAKTPPPRKRKASPAKRAKATNSGSAQPKPAAPALKTAPTKKAAPTKRAAVPAPRPAPRPVTVTPPLLALPAPRIDLARQTRIITALRKNPSLLFRPEVRSALQNEVDYHRPYAAWAANLLKMLTRYEARKRSTATLSPVKQNIILARHIAWQEHQLQHNKMAVNH